MLPFLLLGMWVSSCEKEEIEPNNGEPVVYYVRATDPEVSDSLLVGSFMGLWSTSIGKGR